MAAAALTATPGLLNFRNDRNRREKEQKEAVKCVEADAKVSLPGLQFKLIWDQHSISDQFQSFSTAPIQYSTLRLADDLTSWTSSLLFALKRSVYAEDHGDSDINICMVDTWKTGLSGTTRFYNAATLLKIYEVPSKDKLQHHYYTTEYLTIGSVQLNEVNAHVVPFEHLMRDGLNDLAPQLFIDNARLCLPVENLRRGKLFRQPSELSAQDIENAKRLAHNMSTSLNMAFFIALLSLQRRETDNGLFVEAIAEAYVAGLDGDFFGGKDTVAASALDVDVVEFANLCAEAHMKTPKLVQRIRHRKFAALAAEQELLQRMGNLTLNVDENPPLDEDSSWMTDSSGSEWWDDRF